MTDLDQRDREVLAAMQKEFPVASTPYAIIGQMVDMSEKEVIKRAMRLRQRGVIRSIQIQWDPRALGCTIALVIASVEEEKLKDAIDVVNGHPGVSQNYRRNHEFNLWFTICLPADSNLGLDSTISTIEEEGGISRIHALPALRTYRDGVLDEDPEPRIPDQSSKRRIRALQGELPIQPRPFDSIARKLSESPDDLIDWIREQKEQGTIAQIGAVAASPKRFSTSAMGVWKVPEERVDQVARAFSEDESISSSTVREAREDWPYNVFTIIQGRSVDECERTMGRLGDMANLVDYRSLFPLEEYKRTRTNPVPTELETWERQHSSGSTSAAS
ncbi:MAG: hypothetical protein R3338_11370 [Thermoanaerobaculia bacterium]|nr:hypothetical protein [Thermoanaerobaculia bacterium]